MDSIDILVSSHSDLVFSIKKNSFYFDLPAIIQFALVFFFFFNDINARNLFRAKSSILE